jgi:hypothetical protein
MGCHWDSLVYTPAVTPAEAVRGGGQHPYKWKRERQAVSRTQHGRVHRERRHRRTTQHIAHGWLHGCHSRPRKALLLWDLKLSLNHKGMCVRGKANSARTGFGDARLQTLEECLVVSRAATPVRARSLEGGVGRQIQVQWGVLRDGAATKHQTPQPTQCSKRPCPCCCKQAHVNTGSVLVPLHLRPTRQGTQARTLVPCPYQYVPQHTSMSNQKTPNLTLFCCRYDTAVSTCFSPSPQL